MGCSSDLAAAMVAQGEAIKAGLFAIASKPCCIDPTNVYVQVVQGSTEGGNVQYGTQPPAAEPSPEGDPPEGYETWDEYREHKCRLANWVVDHIISAYRGLGSMSIVGATISAGALGAALGGLITFFPPAAIPLLIAAVIGLGLSWTVQTSIGNYFADHREEFVCGLYNAESAGAAADFFLSLLDDALAALAVASALHPALRTIASVIASTDVMNKLFDDSLDVTYADADCSGCAEAAPLTIYVTTGIDAYNWTFANAAYEYPWDGEEIVLIELPAADYNGVKATVYVKDGEGNLVAQNYSNPTGIDFSGSCDCLDANGNYSTLNPNTFPYNLQAARFWGNVTSGAWGITVGPVT